MYFDSLVTQLQDKTERAFYELEINTKNITNINTPGYKKERVHTFDEILNGEDETQMLQKSMEPGKLNITHIHSDVSLEGQGFFVLLNKHDETVLTRNLNLGRNKDGYLTSGEDLVFPKVKVANNFSGIKVDTNGDVWGKKSDGSMVKVTTLEVVNYPAADKLCFDGKYYYPTEEAGEAMHACLGVKGQTMVRQETQEGSNVDGPLEFAKFNMVNQKISTLARLNQLINTSQRDYIRTLTSAIG
ncbi:MAG: hypothetical protein SFU25_03945 [Candidatus Caenarcaniphilales bacterium]|nr:hypothetical protein [Candidatus Caenarcaniphilales bacterium]